MRTAIITDRSFGSRERAMLARVELGLADEGVRVVQAVPADSEAGAEIGIFSQAVSYDDRGPIPTRGVRAGRLVQALNSLRSTGEERAVGVVHSFGDAWPIAAEVAHRMEAALAVDVWSAAMARSAGRIRAAMHRASSAILLVPDPALERLMLAEAEGFTVRSIPWGVHIPAQARPILPDDRSPSIIISGGGADPAGMAAALEGIAAAAKANPDIIVFMDAHAARKANLWPLVRSFKLDGRLSLIPLLEGRRALALRADILLVPEAVGEYRSIVLDAMAAGLVVLAAADPLVSHLIDRQSARLVGGPDGALWAQAIAEIIEDRPAARSLGESARQHVQQHHRVSTHVAQIMDAYEWMTSGDSLKLPGAQGH